MRREGVVAGRTSLRRLDGDTPPDKGGQVILFEAHQDTVPVDGMTIEPWTPTVRDGRIYGRGSCDIKGGMTAMLGALAAPDGGAARRHADYRHGLHGQRGARLHRRDGAEGACGRRARTPSFRASRTRPWSRSRRA